MSASLSGTSLRQELIETRTRLAESREAVRLQHAQGLPALQACARLSSATDEAVTALFKASLAKLPAEDADRLRGSVSLVPHGGYGRRQMAPFSDVDLMVLYEEHARAEAEQLTRQLTQDIFDIGLHLGQSFRTVEEAIHLAAAEPTVCTSLVEARPLAGSLDLYNRFASELRQLVEIRPKRFSADFVEARRVERQKFGETVYLLEPNIKRSRGGLRDLHLLRWLWYVHTGMSDLDLLRTKGVLSKFDHRRLTISRDFLLRVRNEMHFHAATARDTLDRAEQVRIAEVLGYRGAEGLLPVEQFMREYFRHAGHVWFLTARVIELSSPRPVVAAAIGSVFGRSIERDYRLDDREIAATPAGRAKLATHIEEALRLVDLARLTGRRISQDTWYLVYRSAPQYPLAISTDARERFLSLLDNPAGLGPLLRRLHELGVLERVLPEFAHVRCLLQFNQYHKFTVDEHCIRAVEAATRFADRDDTLGATYQQLPSKRLLHLALLLHDIAKGHEEDHSVLGARIAKETATRLGMSDPEGDQLHFLVLKHLWLSHLAFRRDVRDPELLTSVAEGVGSRENLELLYVLTCADLEAVGPGVLNAWKVEMLTDLLQNAREALAADPQAGVRNRRGAMRDAVWKLLSAADRKEERLELYFADLPESLVKSRPPAQIAEFLTRLGEIGPGEATAWGERQPSGTTEFLAAVGRGTGQGVFARMAGVLSAARLQILSAETAVLHDDTLVLRYTVEGPAEPLAGEPGPRTLTGRIKQICDRLIDSLHGEDRPKFPRVWGAEQQARQAALTNLPSEVRIDPSLSDHHVIVEVFTVDRRGLLYELAGAVHDLGLVIRFAKIATSADQVVDAFYVSEADGSKPQGQQRLDAICERLMEVIAPSAPAH